MASISQIILKEEGNRLRAAFQRAKQKGRITQADVATACGWKNASSFNRLLTGQTALTLDTLEKLAGILEVSLAVISPRLAHEAGSLLDKRLSKLLHVSHVSKVTRGSWTEPFTTGKRIAFHTADESSFALTFDVLVAPTGFAGWVVIIEPATPLSPGDRVITRLAFGRYSLGIVGKSHDTGSVDVLVEGKGLVLSTRQKCMLIAALLPESQLV